MKNCQRKVFGKVRWNSVEDQKEGGAGDISYQERGEM